MTALTALMSIVSPALAANTLADYPTFMANTIVVVGKAASVEDVIGAVDIAVRLAEVGKTTATTTCAAATGAVTGTEKDSCGLASSLSTDFPALAILKTAHYSGLKDTTYSWNSNDYDYREQIDFGAVAMSHNFTDSYVNGTETMVVESGDVKYQFVFEKALTGIGSVSDPNYTYPINIQLLGKAFSIVGSAADNTVKVLQGSIGTATATSAVTYGTYSIYSDLGQDATWARLKIQDAAGNTVDTLIISQGVSKASSAAGLTILPTSVKALQDGTVVGTDLVVGSTTDGVVKTYDTTADVTSTGTASDKFPGETEWGVQVGSRVSPGTGTSFSVAGQISVGDVLEVIYKPASTQYIKAGGKLSLPNSYGDLGFEGWNTAKFVTITIKPLSGTVSAYNYSATTQSFGDLNGIEISSDVGGSIVSAVANNGFDKAYILFNRTRDTGGLLLPVSIGFYDSSLKKVLINDTFTAESATAGVPNSEYVSKVLNLTVGNIDNMTYQFKLSYSNAGDNQWYLTVVLNGSNTGIISGMYAGDASTGSTSKSINMTYQNKTAPSSTSAPSFRLGTTAASAEADEIKATDSAQRSVGKQSQEIVDSTGILLQDTNVNGASDKVVFKVPFKTLYAKVYFGKLGAAAAGETISYASYPAIPMSSAVAKLDTEVEADTTLQAKNMVSVGGPAVNKVTAKAMGLTYPTYGASGLLPITSGQGYIKVYDGTYTTGKSVVVVFGWEAANTRTSATVLQQYDTLLTGKNASAVKVTAATAAGVTAA